LNNSANRHTGQRANRQNLNFGKTLIMEVKIMSIELKQNLVDLKIKLEHLRSYL
jgi:hypothetical protein